MRIIVAGSVEHGFLAQQRWSDELKSPCPSYHNHSRMFLYWSTRVFLNMCVFRYTLTKTPLSVNFDTTGLSLTLTFSDDVINDEEEMAFSSIIRDW